MTENLRNNTDYREEIDDLDQQEELSPEERGNLAIHRWVTRVRTVVLIGLTFMPMHAGIQRLEQEQEQQRIEAAEKAELTAVQKELLALGYKLDPVTGNCFNPEKTMWKNFLSKPEVVAEWGPLVHVTMLASADSIERVPMFTSDTRKAPVQLRQKFAMQFQVADDAFFRATGKHIVVNESFRTDAYQKHLYQTLYLDRIAAKLNPYVVGNWKQGNGRHTAGIALDIANWEEAQDYLVQSGFAGGMYTSHKIKKRRPKTNNPEKCKKMGGDCYETVEVPFRNVDVWHFSPDGKEHVMDPKPPLNALQRGEIKRRIAAYKLYNSKWNMGNKFEAAKEAIGKAGSAIKKTWKKSKVGKWWKKKFGKKGKK